MPTTKPRKRTRHDVALTVEPDLIPPDPTVCHCPKGPTTVGIFRSEQLVEVERRHMRAKGCHRPAEHVDAAAYQADIRGGRR